MTEFAKILDRIDISRVAAYFLYGSEPTDAVTDSYEERVSASYKEVYAKLEALFPTASRTDAKLQDVVADFAFAQSDAYLQIGVMIGFQLYKVLDKGYYSPQNAGIDKVIKNYLSSSAPFQDLQQEREHLLDNFLEGNRHHSMENILEKNEGYQHALQECSEEFQKLEQYSLTKEQQSAVDRLVSAANAIGSEYGAAAYRQGFYDARKLMLEFFQAP